MAVKRATGTQWRWSRYWSEAEARQALSAWRASGMSLAAFATREGIEAIRLRRWLRRLEHDGAGIGPTLVAGGVEMLPVRVVASPAPSAPATFEVAIGRMRLRVAPGFDEAQLVRLVRALVEAEASC